MKCVKCTVELGDHKTSVQISLEMIGNEHSYGYWFCKDCDVYTRMGWVDTFLGPENTFGPSLIAREKGDQVVALIRECPDPSSKRCDCDSHIKLRRII